MIDEDFTDQIDGELASLSPGLHMRRHRFNYRDVRLVHSLLGFRYNEGTFVAATQRPFRPSGLIVWGAPDCALVQQAIIGNQYQASVSCDPVPARWFAQARNYEQIAKMLDEGKEPPAWVHFDTVRPGAIVRINISDARGVPLGPAEGVELCMWGLAVC